MLPIIRTTLVAAAAMLALPSLAPSQARAQAQINIQFGISDAQAKRILRASGHSELKIIKRSLTKVHVEACRKGKRLHLRLDPSGRIIETSQIGSCRSTVTIDQARDIIRRKGYSRINIAFERRGYTAVACRDGRRQKVSVNRFGEFSRLRNMGECKSRLSSSDVTALLKQQGFNRINFTDDQLPKYIARVCSGDRRVELIINRFGKIRDRLQIGRCDLPIGPDQVPAVLAKLGYDRIQVTDERLPRYRAEACRGSDRMEIAIDRYGKLIDEFRFDRCPPPITRVQLADALFRQGFRPVFVQSDANDTFAVNVCRDGSRIKASFSRYGDLLTQDDKGACSLPTLDAVARDFRDRGLKGASFFVEGCRDGRRVRVRVNPFGEPITREQLGQC